MICRLSILGLAFAVLAVTPLHAQGLKDRSVQTDRNLKDTNPARESVVKGAVCSCPRAGRASTHRYAPHARRPTVCGGGTPPPSGRSPPKARAQVGNPRTAGSRSRDNVSPPDAFAW